MIEICGKRVGGGGVRGQGEGVGVSGRGGDDYENDSSMKSLLCCLSYPFVFSPKFPFKDIILCSYMFLFHFFKT